MNVSLILNIEHAKAIVSLLGQQPTHSGAYGLYIDLIQQIESQVKEGEDEVPNAE